MRDLESSLFAAGAELVFERFAVDRAFVQINDALECEDPLHEPEAGLFRMFQRDDVRRADHGIAISQDVIARCERGEHGIARDLESAESHLVPVQVARGSEYGRFIHNPWR